MNLGDFDKNFNGVVMGVDEAGRGPLAGPVVVGAVIIKNYDILPNFLRDSKKLSAKQRNSLYEHLQENAYFSLSIVDNEYIDRVNILQSTLLGMKQVIGDLICHSVNHILVDGNILPPKEFDQVEYHKIIKGDDKSAAIAAASIMAKVKRDQIMKELDLLHPEYCWGKNMGYGTKNHFEMIEKFGVSKYHRKSFKLQTKATNNLTSFVNS